MKKILLSAAGFDPSSGAGVLLDLNVFGQLGFQGMAVLTSITAQNTQLVNRIHGLSPRLVWEQYKTIKEDVSFSGIKVGMVGSKENISVIRKILAENQEIPKVIDPVFRASSGAWLLERKSIPSFVAAIHAKAALVTPNLEEAELITRARVRNIEDMKEAAKQIYQLARIPCLIKGGHLEKRAINVLYDGRKLHFYDHQKLKKIVHGTGCFLSSAVLCFLAKGFSLQRACLRATELTHQAIKKSIPIGHGQHLFSFPRL